MQLSVRKSDNRIDGYAIVGSIEPDELHYIAEIAEIDTTDLFYSTYENGTVIYNNDFRKEEENQIRYDEMVKEQEVLLSKMQRKAVLKILSDSDAYSVRLLFDEWTSGIDYSSGDRTTDAGKFYKCLMDHKSNDTLKPALANYAWVEISDPNEEWPQWRQPLGYADAFKTGDKVSFEEKHYISLIDGNVYSPKDYPQGWKLVE